MIHVLIVDDQKPIRDGLQTMLRQFPLELGDIYSASNGVEALELLGRHSIGLVITDIRMPDMDGLTLIEKARESQLRTEFLIISGYSDFAYAQKAIGLRAKGYLLKPVKREELQAAVEHVWQEIRSGQALSDDLEQASRLARETDRKELRLYMQGAAIDEARLERTAQQYPLLWAQYRLCLLREERPVGQSGTGSAMQVESIAQRIFGREGCICLQHSPYLILAVDAAADPGALSAALQAAQIDAITVMTGPHHGLNQLPAAYVQGQELYRHSYLFPEKRCLLPAHIERLETQWELPYEELYGLFQQMGTKHSGAIIQGLAALFQKQVLQRYPIRYTLQLCRATVQLVEEYERVIRPYLGEEELAIDAVRSLFDYPGIREYIQALQQLLLRLNQLYYDCKCSYRNSHDLNEAVRFIHEHYHKPLDLAMVSNHVSLNYAYFSNLFKKNVGKGFAEYLRDVRLDKARRLLAETDYKVVEVASRVGYESYKSFTRAFREVMHMQPTEYRQLMRQKAEREEQVYEGRF
ncbi:response regulator transcription factor [Paenibacillus sp. 1P07SE]|uniref:response regulator transcription factor n=1 Tax=Paenibacillus sp. 1P07SE TaxID=3132209 RepID=UPI0039A491DB